MNYTLLSCFSALLFASYAHAEGNLRFATNAPPVVVLCDQYDAIQKLAFPGTNAVLLIIADHKGSRQVADWVRAIQPFCQGQTAIYGLADVRGVPTAFHSRIRDAFQFDCKYPVMLDWAGKCCDQFGYQPGVANLVFIRADGTISSRVTGAASENSLAKARACLAAAAEKKTSREIDTRRKEPTYEGERVSF